MNPFSQFERYDGEIQIFLWSFTHHPQNVNHKIRQQKVPIQLFVKQSQVNWEARVGRAKYEDEIAILKYIWESIFEEVRQNSPSSVFFIFYKLEWLQNYKTLGWTHPHTRTHIHRHINIFVYVYRCEPACLTCLLVRLFDLTDFWSLNRRPPFSASCSPCLAFYKVFNLPGGWVLCTNINKPRGVCIWIILICKFAYGRQMILKMFRCVEFGLGTIVFLHISHPHFTLKYTILKSNIFKLSHLIGSTPSPENKFIQHCTPSYHYVYVCMYVTT